MKLAMIFAWTALIASAQVSFAENWPCWRGPRGDGTSTATNLPLQWDGTSVQNSVWNVAIPYAGH